MMGGAFALGALAAITVGGCSGSSQAPPAQPPANVTPASDPSRAAESALHDDTPVDYELPFADKHERHEHRLNAVVTACDAGDKASCWKAMQIALVAERPPILARVMANCRSGDLLSCRALPFSDEQRFEDAPGATGRSMGCERRDPACDRVALRTECATGFPQSCFALARLKPPEPDERALRERLTTLAESGCVAWILPECSWATSPPATRRIHELRACELAAICEPYAVRLRDEGQLMAARDAHERACQYNESDRYRCFGLAESYLDHRYPEPVAGRGQALLDWVCEKFQKTMDKGASVVDMLPQCKRMTPHD